jgi:hypothetical protein
MEPVNLRLPARRSWNPDSTCGATGLRRLSLARQARVTAATHSPEGGPEVRGIDWYGSSTNRAAAPRSMTMVRVLAGTDGLLVVGYAVCAHRPIPRHTDPLLGPTPRPGTAGRGPQPEVGIKFSVVVRSGLRVRGSRTRERAASGCERAGVVCVRCVLSCLCGSRARGLRAGYWA